MSRTGMLILGHGSREASANAEFEHFVGMYRARRPELEVAHAYVELAEPLLDSALQELARRADRVVVLPLFLFAGTPVARIEARLRACLTRTSRMSWMSSTSGAHRFLRVTNHPTAPHPCSLDERKTP